jgi:hypothetical protein
LQAADALDGSDRVEEPSLGRGLQQRIASKEEAEADAFAAPVEKPGLAEESGFISSANQAAAAVPIEIAAASYAVVRRTLGQGVAPPSDTVRIDEMVNYFDYKYPEPTGGEAFSVSSEVAACPWNPQHRLLRVGIQGRQQPAEPEAAGPTIAEDVRVQIKFNPGAVEAYRLLGDENRAGGGGETGQTAKAGIAVTVLYELVPASSIGAAEPGELATLGLKYRIAGSNERREIHQSIRDSAAPFGEASADFRFAASVAAFGLVLRDSPYRGAATLDAVLEYANASLSDESSPQRVEFIELVRQAQQLGLK